MSLRVLVCGGRRYWNRPAVFAKLDALAAEHGALCVIAGGANGADALARQWAKARNAEYHEFRAEWDVYGKSAGHRRNAQMLAEGVPQLVLAFPGGRGTANMIAQARAAGVEVLEVANG